MLAECMSRFSAGLPLDLQFTFLRLNHSLSRHINEIHFLYLFCFIGMSEAYNKPFVGNGALDFVDFLLRSEADVRSGKNLTYAKAVSVLQSSGTGKSRTLTEVCSPLSSNHVT